MIFLYVLVTVLALVLLLAAVRRSDFRIVRSATFGVPAERVFPHVNEFRRWEAWSPWEKIDPNLRRTYTGPSAGVGAGYGWEGNRDVGSGRMTIEESRPAERILIRLEFLKPMPGVCAAEFLFEPRGNGSQLTWTMTGKHSFLPRLIGMFMSMDRMIGGQFEKGLAALKQVSEQGA